MATFKAWILVVAAGIVVAGCGGSEPEETAIIQPVFGGDDEDTADTAGGSKDEFLSADRIIFIGYIAWDDVLEEVVAPETINGGTGNQSAYVARISIEDYDASNPDTYCEVKINIEGLPGVEDPGEGYIWGLDVPADHPNVTSDCISRGWDPADFENESAIGEWSGYEYSIRIGGAFGPDMADWLTNNTSDYDTGRYMAGTWWSTAPLSVADDDSYFYGYEMDDEGGIDTNVQIDPLTVLNDDGKLRRGYYLSRMKVYWNL